MMMLRQFDHQFYHSKCCNFSLFKFICPAGPVFRLDRNIYKPEVDLNFTSYVITPVCTVLKYNIKLKKTVILAIRAICCNEGFIIRLQHLSFVCFTIVSMKIHYRTPRLKYNYFRTCYTV